MKKPFTKEIIRSITHSWGRFWAIFIIVALGAGFYTGLRAAAPDMRLTGDAYFDDTNLMDLHLISTLGFSEDDVASIRAAQGVEQVMAGYSLDVSSKWGDREQVIRIHSLPKNRDSQNGDYMNRPVLTEGRWPENGGECVMNAGKLSTEDSVKVGDVIRLEDRDGTLDDTLSHTEYTVVGLVRSSYYISSSLGSTTIGSGNLSHYSFISINEFKSDAYTDLFATVAGAKALDTFSASYEDLVEPVKEVLKKLAPERLEIRKADVTADARQELADARKEYDKGKNEAENQFAQAKDTLDSGRAELLANEQKLKDSEKQINEGEIRLQDAQKEYDKGMAQLASGQSDYNSGKKKLDAGQAEWEAGARELDAQRAEAEKKLAEAKAQLSTEQAALDSGKQQLADAQKGLQQLEEQLLQLNKGIADLEARLAATTDPILAAQLTEQLNVLRGTHSAVQSAYNDARGKTEELAAQIAAAEPRLEAAWKEYNSQSAQTQAGLEQAQRKLDASASLLAENREALRTAKITLDESLAQLQAAKKQLDETARLLESGKAELAQGREKLDQARTDLEAGQKEYDSQKTETEKTFQEAEQKIHDGEQKLKDMETPEWYVLGRDTNVGVVSFQNDMDRMDSIASVFPLLFFLVAALVALTTMTRMVEEERGLIGTYKALGYGKKKIAFKYLAYALLACLSGSVAGVLICFYTLPAVCWNAYQILYTGPGLLVVFPWDHALAACAAALVCTLGATLAACWATLRESPATLMLPRAPKPGKRIFLEHVPFIWKRLNFTHKVTARNLFRYKKRLIMTVVGIAGCTGLMLTGFGIKDSISSVVSNQFGIINRYDTTIELKDPAVSSGLRTVLDDPAKFSDTMEFSYKSEDFTENSATMTAYVVVPKESGALKQFITLRDRVTHHDVAFGPDSVVLSEKLANQLGVGTGGVVHLKNSAGQQVEFQVTGITENYVYHYVYIAPELYEQKMGTQPKYNQILGISAVKAQEDKDAIAKELQELGNVSTVSFSNDASMQFDNMINSLNGIILLLIFCAGLLAFVVLYNLTNINITERQRELATIKVLGFFDREVGSYVYRETAILTALGCLLGFLVGVLLHSFVIQTVEVDMVMFGRTVAPLSYLWSALLTVLFTIIVDVFMFKKLKGISMVESLKSVE